MNLQNVVTGDNLTKVEGLFTKVIEGIINFYFSYISVLVNVIIKPEILGALAVIFLMFVAYRKFKSKVGNGVL